MGRKIGYLRVSTDEQSTARQHDALAGLCDEMRVEQGVSATAAARPVFEALFDELATGDTLVLWDLDRAFRCAEEALRVRRILMKRGVVMKILTLHVDPYTEIGGFVYAVAAATAELERERLIRRTKEGMAAARKRGAKIGRPKKCGLERAA
jgi:DNA invertase Pin-like site-specific DNA recombinase